MDSDLPRSNLGQVCEASQFHCGWGQGKDRLRKYLAICARVFSKFDREIDQKCWVQNLVPACVPSLLGVGGEDERN